MNQFMSMLSRMEMKQKYNVSPLTQIYNHGFKKHDIALIESIISETEAVIIDRWKEYFNQK